MENSQKQPAKPLTPEQLKQKQLAKVNQLVDALRLIQSPQDHIASAINLLNQIARLMWNEGWSDYKFTLGITTAFNIINYGLRNGKSHKEIAIAINTAFVESTLGTGKGKYPPPNDDTPYGLFQYKDKTLGLLYPGKDPDEDNKDQTEAIYEDIEIAEEEYYSKPFEHDRQMFTFWGIFLYKAQPWLIPQGTF